MVHADLVALRGQAEVLDARANRARPTRSSSNRWVCIVSVRRGVVDSKWTFNVVRDRLRSVPTTWTTGIDFPDAHPANIRRPPQSTNRGIGEARALVFAMDMWSSDFAKPWPRDRTLAWRPHSGRLVAIQSITKDKHELVQELVGGESDPDGLCWRSLSDWDSTALLPRHVCQVGDELVDGCRCAGTAGALELRRHPLVHQLRGRDRRLLRELTASAPIPLSCVARL